MKLCFYDESVCMDFVDADATAARPRDTLVVRDEARAVSPFIDVRAAELMLPFLSLASSEYQLNLHIFTAST